VAITTRSALGRVHVPPTKVFRWFAVNKTILRQPIMYTWDFPDVIKFNVAVLIRYQKSNAVPATSVCI